jgi:hypothetical protein
VIGIAAADTDDEQLAHAAQRLAETFVAPGAIGSPLSIRRSGNCSPYRGGGEIRRLTIAEGTLIMSLITDLFARPAELRLPSKYIIANGMTYMALGLLFVAWPGLVQSIFRDAAFVGHEDALFRLIGLMLVIVGWLYLFGGRSGGRQFVAATVIDRVIMVPVVLVPMALAGIFPHVALTFAVLDPALALGAWFLLSQATASRATVHGIRTSPAE